ncbi:hypothetical protein [Zooshikella ganghwensis]|uniref:Uncharacterized protein n=1 Tax=Zooshikella ganghwensis TaxID=202772 RepID=A0A4P9VLB5_9GAMM|nr:hypothetical protein [Zooshikella ganghwensis]RDH43127.1 hypothetical protein B9G39_06510 [Zooshikella ganghwensis]
MCGGVTYQQAEETIRTFFPNPKSCLPVRNKRGQVLLIPWGRREKQPGFTPLGGWARLESIYSGKWSNYNPRPVKIIIDGFMEKDQLGNSQWYSLGKDEFIQGLLVEDAGITRVYVVTVTDPQSQHKSARWPRILKHQEKTLTESSSTHSFE